jgi:hypothetical protein
MSRATAEPLAFVVELTEGQAYALAELCKRAGWSDCRTLAIGEHETRSMLFALDRVRQALAARGVVVR